MNIDWKGNSKSTFITLGASNHTDKEREINDYYATEPIAANFLMNLEDLDANILEPACGQGHLSEVLSTIFNVKSYDLINRGYGEQKNFFEIDEWNGDIVTNPPYSIAQEFIEHSLKIIPNGNKVCMFLKVQFLEGKKRRKLFEENPPVRIWVSSSRIQCAKNADFEGMKKAGGSAVAYAWFVWEKGSKSETILKWFN